MTIDYPAAAQAGQLRALWKEAFGDSDAFLDIFFGTAFSPTRCRVVTMDDRVAAVLYWFDCKCDGADFAYLYAVATGQDYRRRGLCHALMANTHKLLAEGDYAGAILVPGEVSLRQFYAGMGYLPGCSMDILRCQAADRPISLTRIDAATYAMLRRQLLPENGVVQEGENLAFLSAVADLYEGEDFLLASAMEDGHFRGLELLGNLLDAPGILAALGAESGQFRTPGTQFPFAMYYPLTPDCPEPGWFGLAFD